ncbi:MAG: UDP-N-acetylglucosamine diphosphorylase [Parachlamydiales bacterium]
MSRNALMKDLSTSAFFETRGYIHEKLFNGCHYPWEALSQIGEYLKNVRGNAEEYDLPLGSWIIHPETVFFEEDCIVEPGAYIQGPCYIGRGTIIRNGAYIRGNVVTGTHCVIGHTTEIKNSILLNAVHAAHFAYIGDSILGNNVNLGAGVKLANLRLDGNQIIIESDDDKINTGLRKFGAIIGDGSQIGCNAVCNPGTLVGQKSVWHPCINKGGIIAAGSIVK